MYCSPSGASRPKAWRVACDVGGRRAFPEHLLDGISGNQVDHQENQRDDQPDDWKGIKNALGYGSQLSVLVVP